MKVRHFLNDVPVEEISEEKLREFALVAQEKMLKAAGYAPVHKEEQKTA